MIVFSKPPDAPPPAVTVELDEYWVQEWIAFGFVELSASLAKHAEFDRLYPEGG